ncbi:hypothetical protein TVAG_149820 [Trichomonas vaginalis G3]|uniref:Uncharacterized protein n=1 Tax=Trichomonas vaginalis (strain ATCC PRA-98 / G3) TaxID=412133 RepID=A2FIL3_TRIV3|nr:hypothetical protein TVAGG3_0360480 [Trichomonas vaginalis G3]EAX95262.1 hypothetical protein TVAG_149820 [Trichomonas vaginalis G3]KAI5531908.1 hypothetical protein TVAGG3_0360480 [Trichomonas vaginalis G3]|eukprot:XP_001308192.1 hypothetical protein [Trichomonas vaginalis G3]
MTSRTTRLDNTGLYLKKPITRAKTTLYVEPPPQLEYTIQPMTKRRKALLNGKANIDRKKLQELIEDGDPTGFEILERISHSPTEFKNLIALACDELKEYYRLKAEAIEKKTNELKRNEKNVLDNIKIYEDRMEHLQNTRHNLQIAINTGNYRLNDLTEKAKKLTALIESDKRVLQAKQDSDLNSSFQDDTEAKLELRIQLYQKERERLENLCAVKQDYLLELNNKIKELCMKISK